MQTQQRHWIPPGGLLAGFAAHGISWIVLLLLALRGSFAIDLPALAWIHLVVLGWLTMIALSVLIHVVPTFTDAPWKDELIPRRALGVYALGVAAFIAALWWSAVWLLPWAATLIVVALVVYAIVAIRTLAQAYAQSRVEAAIARALTVTFGSLLVTAALGVSLAWMLAGRVTGSALGTSLPQIHAAFGTMGWLTVLVMGVSTRTVRPITGARPRFAFAHPIAGGAVLGGLIILVTASALQQPALGMGGRDHADRRRATLRIRHRRRAPSRD